MALLVLFAFLGGVVTILSPCVLPVLPAILSGSATGGKNRPLGIVVGLIISFTFFTLALTALVKQFGLSANFLRYIAILMIGFFGMVMVMPYLSDRFAKLTSFIGDLGSNIQSRNRFRHHGFLSGILLGSALGLVWTPCAGPILAAITTLVATQNINFAVILLTLAYSLGAAIPLLGLAYGGRHLLASVPFFAKYSELTRKIFGWIMILTAFALAFNWDVAFQQRVLEYLPNIQIENTARVQEELNKLRPNPVGFPDWTDASSQQTKEGQLPKIAPAPNLTGIVEWVNSPPLTLQELRGKVVLIDFWTYSCINCIRTFPYLTKWYANYKDKGLVIIGVHTPEFEFEKNVDNVKKATERFHITYPVAMDNNYGTWEAYHNSYWPAHYLIDQNGIVRQVHFGEGKYLETENAIRTLLGEEMLQSEVTKKPHSDRLLTPETYLGYKRAKQYVSSMNIVPNQTANYSYNWPVPDDKVGLKGLWNIGEESITSQGEGSTLELNFLAGRVYLVLGGSSSDPITVELDGKPVDSKYYTKDMDGKGNIFVKEARKYDIVNLKNDYGRHTLVLRFPKGIEVYAFTFGVEDEM